MKFIQTLQRFILYIILHVLSVLVLNYPFYWLIDKQSKVPKSVIILATFTVKTYIFNWMFFCNLFTTTSPDQKCTPVEVEETERMDLTPDDIVVHEIAEELYDNTHSNYPKDGGDYRYY
ncbi:hypothetical protein MOSE0_A04698 [Monosporozyma servazzii]